MPTQHGRARGVAKLINKQNCGGNKKSWKCERNCCPAKYEMLGNYQIT